MSTGAHEDDAVRRLTAARPAVPFEPLDGASIRRLAGGRHRLRTGLVVPVVAVPVVAAALVVVLIVLAVGTGGTPGRTVHATAPAGATTPRDCRTAQLRFGTATTWEDLGTEYIDLRVQAAPGVTCLLPSVPYQVRLRVPSSATLMSAGPPAPRGTVELTGGGRGSTMVVLGWRPPCLAITTVLHVDVVFFPGGGDLSEPVPVDNPPGFCPVGRGLPSSLTVQPARVVGS